MGVGRSGRFPGWTSPKALAALLGLLGILTGAATVQMGRRYVEAAATLSRFEVSVQPVSHPGAPVGVSVQCRNPGPWPVTLLEVQVLAWRDGEYLGAASRDLRRAPLVLPPAGASTLDLTFPDAAWPGAEPDRADGEAWYFTVSGRIELPVLGARSFSRESRYVTGEGGVS